MCSFLYYVGGRSLFFCIFFFNDTATTEIYTLSLHDALPISLPAHAHVHEQVVNMIEGVFELTIAGETRTLGQGSVAIIPSNALHSGKAITDCRIIDAFYPIREDYR